MNKEGLIEKYFNNSLSGEELQEFNRLLSEDPEFKEEFLFQKDLKKALVQNQKKSIKSTLQNFEKEISAKNKRLKLRRWMMAASVIVLLGLSFFFYYSTQQKKPENLFAAYFEPYRNIVNPIVRGDRNDSVEKKAFVAYENGKYYKAINLFASLDEEPYYIEFYKAMSLMAVDKNMEAVEILSKLVSTQPEDQNFKLYEKAHWYLALAYLKSNEKEKSRELLEQIVNNETFTFKKEKAAELLDDLD